MNNLKKIMLTCFAVFFVIPLIYAQCPQGNVSIETQAEVNDFAVLYPDCTEIIGVLTIGTNSDSDISDLSPLSQITSIGGGVSIVNNPNLVNLSGLENATSIGNHLNIVDNFNLINLNGLENLTSIPDHLSIFENANLSSLSGLGNVISVGSQLRVTDNDKLENFRGLESLISVAGDFVVDENDMLINFNGLENLTSIDGIIFIWDNITLNSLSGLQNFDYSTIITLDIADNPMLFVCNFPSVCSHIQSGNNATIFNNASGCNNPFEILDACSSIPKIQIDAFYDINQNKIQDTTEPNYYDISISITPGEDAYYTQNNGIFLQPGSYTAAFDTANNPNWQLTTDSTNYFLSLEEGETDTITFGIYPTQQISRIQTTINSAPARCNETIRLDVTTKNIGTTIASGIMWLTIDDAIPAFNFIHQPDTIVADFNAYGWYFTDLFPGQTIIRNVDVVVPGPPDFELGERLLFVSFSDFTDINGEDGSEGFRYNPEVRCSFDPNDKLVNPNREGEYVLFEEDFIYTIRFQNTGNDVAFDVVIRDTLDVNLDLSTFRLLGSSHANRLNTILNEDEGILTFEFRDIFLPDSTSNFDASQGYVNYLISPFDGLAEETPITNSAGIFFDLNPPVITNTVQSIMVSELPTVSTENPDNLFDFNILPNPNTGIFTVQNIPKGTYQIHNTSGQIIQEGNMQNDLQIDISSEAQGVYFMSVTIDNTTAVRRIIKM